MKKIIFSLLLFCLNHICAQVIDYDIYDFNDLANQTAERKELINELTMNGDDLYYFKHFYYTSPNASKLKFEQADKDFVSFISQLKEKIEGLKKSNNEKIIKLVAEETNEKYLKSFVLQSSFKDIIEKGEYNYFTSAALYMSVLSSLKIPFTFKEYFTHAEVYAYPKEEKLLLLAPNPMGELRYIEPSTEFKNNFILLLRKNNLLLSNEVNNRSTNEIFLSEYYLNNSNHNRFFVAVLYFNECLIQTIKGTNNKFDIAILGNIYNPSFKGNVSVSTAVSEYEKNKLYDFSTARSLELLARNNVYCDNNTFEGIFQSLTQKVLFENSNITLYDSCAKYIINKTNNKQLKQSIILIYNTERGRFKLLNYEYVEAIPNLLLAHSLAPKNINLRTMTISAILNNVNEIEKKGDEKLFNEINIDNYLTVDSFLLEDEKFRYIYYEFLGEKIEKTYKSNDFIQGDLQLLQFENIIKKYSDVLDGGYYGFNDAFLAPARIYQKQNNIKKAIQYVERGLKVMTNDTELKQKLDFLKR